MKDLVLSLVTTNSGWLTRFALKYVAIGLASLTTFLTTHNVSGDHTSAIVAGVGAVAAAALEQGLSWVARKYKVPAAK